ncbi:50S ribosomal protein L21 [Pirellulimonas nuda]|uniref:Large ribosomal subunit protein bL21 n=1 Tax=Pirellulimonas nuda TaxID=2528009 RepID=A0A518DIN1_9BACT|nr:50S ribosomal protein L21 [Pirellulimonas nuda]QDU91343.1 50S ribosomal protein L21 [Pirellulimonas nuda]
MYAIIVDGGRQYRVEEGQVLSLDYRESVAGDTLTFDRVLAVGGGEGIKLGAPLVEGATVTAEVMGLDQGPKIRVQKMRRRKNFRKRTGHRAMYTKVRIGAIAG